MDAGAPAGLPQVLDVFLKQNECLSSGGGGNESPPAPGAVSFLAGVLPAYANSFAAVRIALSADTGQGRLSAVCFVANWGFERALKQIMKLRRG